MTDETEGDQAQPSHGSSFESFPEEDGNLEEATAKAIKRMMAWQLAQAMKEHKVSKAALAKRLSIGATRFVAS